MAEGGEPDPNVEMEYPKWNWDRGSLEYVFASDFIHFVIERENKEWRSHGLITHRSPLTPFNTAIQNAVEGILRKDSTCLKLVFKMITKQYDKLNQVRYIISAIFLKRIYFGTTLHDFNYLLKYFCMISYFSAWALGQGLHAAPFFCVDLIIGYIREFLVEHNFTNMDTFWYFCEREAGSALNLGNFCILKEEDLIGLSRLQMLILKPPEEMPGLVEGSSEEMPGKVEGSSEDIQVEETKTETKGESRADEGAASKGESRAEQSNIKPGESSKSSTRSSVMEQAKPQMPSNVGKNESKLSTKSTPKTSSVQQKQKQSRR